MAKKKIAEFPSAESLGSGDYILGSQGGTTKKFLGSLFQAQSSPGATGPTGATGPGGNGGLYLNLGGISGENAINFSSYDTQEFTLNGDVNFSFTGGTTGGIYTLIINQESIGRKSISWPNSVKWSRGYTPVIQYNGRAILDSVFTENTGTGFSDYVYAGVMQSDEKMIFGGQFGSYNGNTARNIVRILPSGFIDESFDTSTGFDDEVTSLYIQNDNKILVGGGFNKYRDIGISKRIARLNPDGTLDSDFAYPIGSGWRDLSDVSTRSYTPLRQALDYQIGNNIVGLEMVMHDTTNDTYYKFKFTQWTQGAQGGGFSYQRQLITEAMDEPIVEFTATNYGEEIDVIIPGVLELTRGNQNGIYNVATEMSWNSGSSPAGTEWNTSFVSSAGFNNDVKALRVLSDGSVIVGGYFSSYNGISTGGRIAKMSGTDGTLDTDFATNNGTGFDSDVFDIAIGSDDSIYVVGYFQSFDSVPTKRIAKLSPAGILDSAFTDAIGNGATSTIRTIEIQEDQKILIGGDFIGFDTYPCSRLARLNSDGTVDADFIGNIGTGFNEDVTFIKIHGDKILVGGRFTTFNNKSANGLVRLNMDGSRDESFDIGTGQGDEEDINSILVSSDGGIILAGEFYEFQGNERCNNIAKVTNPVSITKDVIRFVYNGSEYIGI